MYRFASAAAFALLLLACGAAAVDPKLGEFKKIPKDSIASLLLVDTSFYADPSQVEIHVNCPPDKGNLSLSYPPETASPGTLLFKPYAGAFGQDFFTFTVTGPLKGGLTSEQVAELQNTKIARLDIIRTNDPPIPPENGRFEIQAAPGAVTEAKMRRGCYNRPQGGLNAFNICVREFPQDLDAVLPMELDLDRDPLRFIVTKLPEKGVLLSVDEDSGLFSFQPNEGVTADWDSFKYYITDCPRGCTPENGCLTKTPPGCANTVNVTVSIRIGDPSGMRGRSKSYSVWEDRILATGWIDPTSPGIPGGLVQLERSTFEEAEWSNAEAAAAQLRWRIINPPARGAVQVLGCNETTVSSCNDEALEFVYTPDPNFFGEDHFTYRVEDRNAPHANDDYDGTVSILVIGTPDPPVAVGATLDIPMARLELSDMRNAKRIVLRVEEYDNDANEMWMIVASDIVNGTLYSAPLDLDGDEVDLETAGGFGDEIVAMMYYNMSLAAVQDLETGRVFEKVVYYLPSLVTRGMPVDAIRWATMSGATKDSACSTLLGWVILPEGLCASSNRIASSAIAETVLTVQCAKGYSILETDSSKCSMCTDGTYAPGLDLPGCSPCGKGRFSNSMTGHEECTRCPENSYADEPGSSECKSCPAIAGNPSKTSITVGNGKTSISDCVCQRKDTRSISEEDRGYYGPPGGTCRPCPAQGARCMNDNMTWPVNDEGFYIDLDFEDHIATILPCSHNDACPAHDDWYTMRWKPCADGYNGTRCAECWDRCDQSRPDGLSYCYPEEDPRYEWWNPLRVQHYRFDEECRKCPRVNALGLIIGVILGLLLLAPIIIKLADAVKNLPSVSISICFVQILAVFPRFSIDWPASMAWLWEKLSFFNLNVQLLAPECVFAWKWIYTYILTISTPVALIIFGLLILLLRVLHTLMARTLGSSLRRFFPTRDCKSMDPLCNYHNLCKDCHARPAQERPNPGLTGPPCGSGRQLWISKKRYQMGMFLTKAAKRDQYVDMFMGETRVLLTFLKIGYIFLSSATIGYFDCVGKDVVGGRQYLDADPTLECYNWDLPPGQDATWPTLFPLAVFALLLYPVGIVALFGGLLYRIRKSLDSKVAKSWIGILYVRFKPQYFYWELNIFARKLFVVLCTALFSAETKTNGLRQLLFGMLVLLAALLAHMYAYPFDRKNLNILESTTIAAQFFSLFVGLAFLSDKMSSGFSKFMEYCNLAVMGISFLACGYYILLDLSPDFRTKYAEFWEKRHEQKLRKQKEKDRMDAGESNGISLVGYKKVMEFRWRATIGAVASRLLTATGARILNELIQSNQSLDEIINQGRPEGKKIDVPVDANGRPLTKKEAIRKCFEDLSNFIHDDDDLRIREERQYVYEYFRPNVRNVILEGLSREEKETTDRLKNFLKMVLDADNASKQQGGILGALLNKSSKGSAVSRTKSAETTVQVDDDSDEDDAAQIAPSDAEPLLSRVAE